MLVYLFLCFSVKALEVATTIFNLVLSQNPAGGTTGGVVGAVGAGGGDEATRQINPLQLDRSVPTFPLLISLAMGALMRVAYVQRVEQWLRRFAHWVFGIPTVQVKLLDRMLRTRVDLPRLEADIAFEDGAERYSHRIERYAAAAASVLKSGFSKREFRDRLGTIFAFKAWVSEQRIWPSNGLTSDSSTFAPLYATVLDEITVLEKESRALVGSGARVPPWRRRARRKDARGAVGPPREGSGPGLQGRLLGDGALCAELRLSRPAGADLGQPDRVPQGQRPRQRGMARPARTRR